MTLKIRFGAGALVLLLGAGAVGLAQGARTTADGVYTEAQAKRGATAYAAMCAACHGEDLKGSAVVPGLIGADFEVFWKGQPVADLFDKINTTMPKTAPGTLMPQQSADLVAYLLSAMKAPAGATDLSAKLEDLKQIRIAAATP